MTHRTATLFSKKRCIDIVKILIAKQRCYRDILFRKIAQKELTVIVLKGQTVVMKKKMNAVCLKNMVFVIENTEEGMTTKIKKQRKTSMLQDRNRVEGREH